MPIWTSLDRIDRFDYSIDLYGHKLYCNDMKIIECVEPKANNLLEENLHLMPTTNRCVEEKVGDIFEINREMYMC